jgi:hypothetical protein
MAREKEKVDDLLSIKPMRLYERPEVVPEDDKKSAVKSRFKSIFIAWVGDDECATAIMSYSNKVLKGSRPGHTETPAMYIFSFWDVYRIERGVWDTYFVPDLGISREGGVLKKISDELRILERQWHPGIIRFEMFSYNYYEDLGHRPRVHIHDDKAIVDRMKGIFLTKL